MAVLERLQEQYGRSFSGVAKAAAASALSDYLMAARPTDRPLLSVAMSLGVTEVAVTAKSARGSTIRDG